MLTNRDNLGSFLSTLLFVTETAIYLSCCKNLFSGGFFIEHITITLATEISNWRSHVYNKYIYHWGSVEASGNVYKQVEILPSPSQGIKENFKVDDHVCVLYFPITLLTASLEKLRHKLGHFVHNKLVIFYNNCLRKLNSVRSLLPSFKPWRTRYESVNYGISN